MTDSTNTIDSDPDHDWRHSFAITYEIFIYRITLFSFVVMAALILRPFGITSSTILLQVDFLICLIFLLDFFRLLRRAPNRQIYFFRQGGWLDLIGSVPSLPLLPLTALLRVGRLNGAVRTSRHLRSKDREDVLNEAPHKPAVMPFSGPS